jgi:hypothetical protein
VRRVVIVLAFAIGCGFSGLSTGEPLDAVSDGGPTLADGAPSPGGDAALPDAAPVTDARSDAPAGPVPCASGRALCSSNGLCFEDCGDDDNCPGKKENCFTCSFGAPLRETCESSCASSACPCFNSSNCPSPDEFCAFPTCQACGAGSLGTRCKNGLMCRHCKDGTFKCASSDECDR